MNSRTSSFSLCTLLALLALLGMETLRAQEKAALPQFDLATEILSLRSEAFKERADAETNIQAWAQENKAHSPSVLLGLHDDSTHPEARTRLFRILRKIQTSDFSQGFIGIQMGGNLMRNGLNPAPAPAQLPGVQVILAVEGGPAKKAGILPGDIITQVDDVKTDGPDGSEILSNYVKSKHAGEKVRLHYLRQGKEKELLLTLAAYDQNILAPFGGSAVRAKEVAQEEAFQNWIQQERAAQATKALPDTPSN